MANRLWINFTDVSALGFAAVSASGWWQSWERERRGGIVPGTTWGAGEAAATAAPRALELRLRYLDGATPASRKDAVVALERLVAAEAAGWDVLRLPYGAGGEIAVQVAAGPAAPLLYAVPVALEAEPIEAYEFVRGYADLRLRLVAYDVARYDHAVQTAIVAAGTGRAEVALGNLPSLWRATIWGPSPGSNVWPRLRFWSADGSELLEELEMRINLGSGDRLEVEALPARAVLNGTTDVTAQVWPVGAGLWPRPLEAAPGDEAVKVEILHAAAAVLEWRRRWS